VAVKIKLARYGKIREPYYRVVVADSRTRRSGRAIETIGRYNPKADPSIIEIESERAQYWLGVGAQATEAVVALFKVTGDWQTFKGLPGTEGTLKPQPEKVDKRALYDAAIAAAGGRTEDGSGATTARKKAPPKKAEPATAPADATPAKAAAAAPADAAPARAVDTAPADAKPSAAAPARAADTEAAETEAAETEAADTEAAETEAAEPSRSATDAPAAGSETAKSEPAEADAAPFGEGSHAPLDGDAQPAGFPIKGNASSRLYHRPGTPFYESTIAEVWFASAEAAVAAGFSLPKSQQDGDDAPAESE